MPKYICDNCEDYEEMAVSDFRKGVHCECGGHLYLKLEDHFIEHKNMCFRCKNYASIWCVTCKWAGESNNQLI